MGDQHAEGRSMVCVVVGLECVDVWLECVVLELECGEGA